MKRKMQLIKEEGTDDIQHEIEMMDKRHDSDPHYGQVGTNKNKKI